MFRVLLREIQYRSKTEVGIKLVLELPVEDEEEKILKLVHSNDNSPNQ